MLENYPDPNHGVTHTEIARIVQRARYIFHPLQGRGKARPNLYVCLSTFGGQLYESYVYLLPELRGYPARCVIVTCYKCRRPEYLALFSTNVFS